MDKRLIGLKLLMDHLHVDVDRFEDRKMFQFSMILLQRMGLDLRYRFGWYATYPWSPELTRDMFWVNDPISLVRDFIHDYELGQRALETLKKFRDLVQRRRPENVDRLEWLEILAEITFLTDWPSAPNDFDSVFQELVERREHFQNKKDTIREAWEALHEVGVV